MTLFDSEPSRQLIDLFILLCGIVALVYAVSRRHALRSLYPVNGLIVMATGTTVFVLLHLVDVTATTGLAADLGIRIPGSLSGGVPDGLYWLLSRISFLVVLAGLSIGTRHRRRLEWDVSDTRDKFKDAQDIVVRSEGRFRNLFETTSNSIYCYAFDPPMSLNLPLDEQVRRSQEAVLTECNKVFARTLDVEEPADIVGTKMSLLDANNDTEAHFNFFSSFINNDYRLTDYELVYKTPEGDERAVRSSLTGIVKDGFLHRFWGAETNILDLLQTKRALHRSRNFEKLMTEISSRLVISPLDIADEAILECMEKVCRYVNADRTTIFWLDHQKQLAHSNYSWSKTDETFEESVSLVEYSHLTERVLSGSGVRIDDVAALPDDLKSDRDGLLRAGIKSLSAMPLIVGGEIVGVSTQTHIRAGRTWSDQDIGELRVFADLFASYIQRLKSRRALDRALAGLQHATDRLEAENVYLRQEIELTQGFDEIVGRSDGILHCLHLVERVADTLTPVLIMGETGTGKELIARAIHEHSNRHERPLVKVNCAALPSELIESELFGFEKGAFTGAERTRRGRFDLANGSTLLLDEIGDIPLELQAKLLRALQEGEIERLGGSETITVDVRIIAATNRNLHKAVSEGKFRSDLFYRINTFPIELPPLRDRGDDIQLLAENFVKVHAQKLGRNITAISAEMMQRLQDYSWPGNVRELESVIQRALISSSGPVLQLAASLSARDSVIGSGEPRVLNSSVSSLEHVERDHIFAVLEEAKWKISGASGAASKLGIPPSTLRSKMKKLAIVRPH